MEVIGQKNAHEANKHTTSSQKRNIGPYVEEQHENEPRLCLKRLQGTIMWIQGPSVSPNQREVEEVGGLSHECSTING